jgi:hypothetical protein
VILASTGDTHDMCQGLICGNSFSSSFFILNFLIQIAVSIEIKFTLVNLCDDIQTEQRQLSSNYAKVGKIIAQVESLEFMNFHILFGAPLDINFCRGH